MKKQLLIILTTIISFHCYSQISFEKGYFINNDNQKIDCLIKNKDWKYNPKEIQYKLLENSEPIIITIKSIKEFEIYNYSKFTRSNVNIDRSSSNIDVLSSYRNPIFEQEKLFLQILVDGKFKLYEYKDENLIRFFFQKSNTNKIEQLVFKNYKSANDNLIRENNGFRQQLLSNLKCKNIKVKDIKKIKYKKNELANLIEKYNHCEGIESINFVKKQKKDLFNLTIRPRLNSSSLFIQNNSNTYTNTDFGSKVSFSMGIEIESILPFNKNKWSVIFEPTYQYFNSQKEVLDSNATNIKVEYKSIEVGIGIRHYLFLNDNSKLFINGLYIRDFPSKSKLNYNSGIESEISSDQNFGYGIGYNQNDKFSLELRHQTKRALLYDNSFESDFKTFSVIIGYSLF